MVIAITSAAGAGAIIGAVDLAWKTWQAQSRAGTYFNSEWDILIGLVLVGIAVKTYQGDLRAYILAVVMLTIAFLGAAVELILHPSYAFGGFVAGLAVAVFNAFVGLRVRLAFRRQRARVA